MARSTIKGAASYRRFLRRLPDSATGQFGTLLTFAAPNLAAYMRSLFPNKTGHGQASIGYKGPTKALNLKIGQVDKNTGRAFYINILNSGVRAGQKQVKRRTPSGGVTSYMLGWKGRPPIGAVKKTADYFRGQYLPDYRNLTNKILADASQGAGDD